MKISVMGFSGSGKSTVSKFLSEIYDIPLLYLDKVKFVSDWKERDKDEISDIIFNFLNNNDCWVIDGNYNNLYKNERLESADKIIIIKLPALNCLFRIIKRYKDNKGKVRESMADGCKEKIDAEFIWWILFKSRNITNRKNFFIIKNKYKDKCIVLRSQKAIDKFMNTVIKESAGH